MRWRLFAILGFLILGSVAEATEGRVIKVLPLFLDLKGRESVSPSLYDRDAYQARLRRHPAERSGLRFDIQWKAKAPKTLELQMIVQIRGVAEGQSPKEIVLENKVKQEHWFSHWTGIKLDESEYLAIGEVTAWRVTLWDGDKLLSEQKSFLW
jgi:hypothetical protein